MSDQKILWCAVIDQAITDATAPVSTRRDVRMDQQRAREWLTKPNSDFEEVCALAGIEADRVRAKAARLIENVGEQASHLKQARIPVRGLYHHDGRSLTLPEWAAETGMAYHVLYERLRRGWSIERTLTTPTLARQPTPGLGQSGFKSAPDRNNSPAQETTNLEIF